MNNAVTTNACRSVLLIVIPAKAGIQLPSRNTRRVKLDPGFRRDDGTNGKAP